jgi:AcrR family transcriptional regulator
MLDTGRTNQKRRTRAALVKAALEMLRAGSSPTVSEVAHAALVSPATAYRYFPSARALWSAVLAEISPVTPDEVFAQVPADAEARVDALIRAVGFRVFDDEALWRTAARLMHDRASDAAADEERIPVPTGKRLRWIEHALGPVQHSLPPDVYRRLSMALALVIGAETVLALREVCALPSAEAKDVVLWAGRALVRAAQADAQQRGAERSRTRSKPATAAKRSRTAARKRKR